MPLGQMRFEVGVYNAEVRQLVAQGQRHRQLKDDWADVHYIEVVAASEAAARAKIAQRYPAAQGYVIESCLAADARD